MNYEPKFVEGYSIQDCDSEIQFWFERNHRYGGMDWNRIHDLEHTKKMLRESEVKNEIIH